MCFNSTWDISLRLRSKDKILGGNSSVAVDSHLDLTLPALQMFAGIYGGFIGKAECGDFKFMGIARIPAIPVIKKSPHSDFHVKIVGILTLQGYYRDTPH